MKTKKLWRVYASIVPKKGRAFKVTGVSEVLKVSGVSEFGRIS